MREGLRITQIRCRQLPDVEQSGKGFNPYVCITFRGETRRTDWKEQDINPIFKDVLGFDLKGYPILSDDVLEIEVKLQKMKFVRDSLLCTKKIFLTPLGDEGITDAPFCVTLNDADDNATDAELDFIAMYDPPIGSGSSINVAGSTLPQENENSITRTKISRRKSDDDDIDKLASFSKKTIKNLGLSEDNTRKVNVQKRRVHDLPDRPMFFQVKIRIIKGRHLIGTNIYPSVRVIIDGERKGTKPSRSSYQPFFNEPLVFNFNERPNCLFDKIARFEVHTKEKLLKKDSIIGTFSCDLGTFYFEKDHAVMKKWLLLTVPRDENEPESLSSHGSPAGFLQINAIILGTGDELPEKVKVTTSIDEIEDIESNLLLPIGGASLETATFFIKIYSGEDLPQMDPDFSKFKFFGNKDSQLCDPYCKFTFAGRSVRTTIKKETYTPVFEEELKISYKYPSMCERLKLQILDWDRASSDDCIGTSFISLHELTGLGDPEFLPSFGPSYVCYYGSLREFSNVQTEEADLMDKGLIEGAFYRGRMLVELSSSLGTHDKKITKGFQESDKEKVKRFLPGQRRKYMLFATFMRGNLIDSDKNLIEFEVSIGNYGSTQDKSGNLKYSSTLPVNPVTYGNGYYYLPWHASKPCCIVESHWEDIRIRLEPKIFLTNIVHNFNKNIEKLDLLLQTKLKGKSIIEKKTISKMKAKKKSLETTDKERSKDEMKIKKDKTSLSELYVKEILDSRNNTEVTTTEEKSTTKRKRRKKIKQKRIPTIDINGEDKSTLKNNAGEKSKPIANTEEDSNTDTSTKMESTPEKARKKSVFKIDAEENTSLYENIYFADPILKSFLRPISEDTADEIPITLTNAEKESITENNDEEIPIYVANAEDESITLSSSEKILTSITNAEEIPITLTNAEEESISVTSSEKIFTSITNAEEIPITLTNAEEDSITVTSSEKITTSITNAEEIPITLTNAEEESIAETKDVEKCLSNISINEKSISETRIKKSSLAGPFLRSFLGTITGTNVEEKSTTETKAEEISTAETNAEEISTAETNAEEISTTESNPEEISVTNININENSLSVPKTKKMIFFSEELSEMKSLPEPISRTTSSTTRAHLSTEKPLSQTRTKKTSVAHMTTAKDEKETLTLEKVIYDLISAFDAPFPMFKETDKGVTLLDAQIQKTRVKRLIEIVEDLVNLCNSWSENRPELDESAITLLKSYSQRIEDLAMEPQMSLPDIVISMISGEKTIAYKRIPTYTVMFSQNEETKGMYCGKLQNVKLKYLNEKNKDDIPASLDLILWFGLEEYQDDWIKNEERESKHSIYAETFENQWRIMGKWTAEGCPRPSFSDINGKIKLERNDFVPPAGWMWEGDWHVAPEFNEFDEMYDKKPIVEKFEQIFENETRNIEGIEKFKLLSVKGIDTLTSGVNALTNKKGRNKTGTDARSLKEWHPSDNHWTDEQNRVIKDYDKSLLEEGWMWEPDADWEIDKSFDRSCDEEGWGYSSIAVTLGCDWSSTQKAFHRFRRRRYIRKRIINKDYSHVETRKNEVEEKDPDWAEWSYANLFGQFHKTKKASDILRRKRWRRMMVADVGEKSKVLPSFLITDNGKEREITPRVFSVFNEHRMWQLRAYIYSARNIVGMNEDSTSDAYCVVTFQNRSQVTETIYKSLSPVWDETMIFDSVPMYGNPDMIVENPPLVNVELYDAERLGSNEFLGRCMIQPHVRKENAGCFRERNKLLWYKIKIADFDGGELLAAFSLFVEDGLEPERPSVKEGKARFIIPETIRPKEIRTGVEVLIWGVRNLKTFQMAPCTSPQVYIEIGGKVIKSDVIKNIRQTPNFPKCDFYQEIMLPKDPFYMPPINIRVYDHRTWGRKPLVGTHVIKDVEISEPPSQGSNDLAKIEPSEPKKEEAHYVALDTQTGGIQDIMKKRKLKEEDREEDFLDWWSKYYASCNDKTYHTKCGKYLEKGYKPIQIYTNDLEEVEEFGGLDDVIDTFLLERGREDEEDEEAGEFKGNYRLYPLPEDANIEISERYFSSVKPMTKPIECTVRVYVIRATELNPTDTNGKCDPYLVVQLGSKKISSSENRIPCTTDPFFGQYYELKAKIPVVKDLVITVMDHDYGTQNDLIGSTTIDLENRLLSKARSTVGLAPQYCESGPYRWRDSKTPKQILKEVSAPVKPVYIGDDKLRLKNEEYCLSDFEKDDPTKTNPHLGNKSERLALHVLHEKEFHHSKLVPEHVETRTLYDPFDLSIGQGELQLFVDIFPSSGTLPPPLNIKPRTPRNFVFRVIIWGTAEVPCMDKSAFGEEMTDIYIKGWLAGCVAQKTDVHYRSLNGEGLFNWRMTYPFKYMPEESIMIIEEKENFWSLDKTQVSNPPIFTVEVWDHDLFSSNDYIGKLELNLNKIPRPKQSKGSCKPSMLKEDKDKIDLFEKKHIKGWWVMTEREKDESGAENRMKKGEIEMTLEILTEAEAKERPAGKGREEPNVNPKLDEPKRPDTSFLWLKNPIKSFRYIIWRRFKWHIISLFVILLLIIFLCIFIAGLIDYSAQAVIR